MKASTVSDYLGADHRRLDALAVEVGRLIAAGSFDHATIRFAEFVAGLSRHIDVEEQVLFPAFEESTGIYEGPTVVMRAEHVTIRGHMNDVTAALSTEDGARANEALRALADTLGPHNMREERVLYPMADEALGSANARTALVRDMEAL